MLQLLRRITLTASLCLYAFWCMAHGPIHEKIAEVSKKIEKNPTDPSLYVERAGYYKIDGNLDKSFADYKHARNLDSTLETLDLLIAELFFEFDHFHSALACATAFEQQQINTAECYLLKAKIYDKLFMADSALHYAEASYPFQSKPSTHFFVTVKEYVLFADKTDYKKASFWLDEGKKRMPFDLVIQEEYVNLALRFENYSKAEALCLEQIPKLKRKEYWYNLLASVYVLQDEKGKAIDSYSKALTLIDKLPRHHKNTSYIINLKSDIDSKLSQLKS